MKKSVKSLSQIVADLQRKSGLNKPATLKQYRRKPALYYHCKTERGYRYIRVESTTDDTVARYPSGRFFVRERTSDSKVKWTLVEGDVQKALGDAQARALHVDALRHHPNRPRTIDETLTAFYEHYEDAQQFEALKKARETLTEFFEIVDIRAMRDIRAEHVVRFTDALRENGNAPRTLHNKVKRLRFFFKWAKLDVEQIIPKKNVPKYEKTEPTTYEPAVIEALLTMADEHMQLCIELGRQLGLREREMMHAEFSDIEVNRTFRVQAKPRYKFTTKTHEQRVIPMSAKLHRLLFESKKKRPRSLILGIGVGYKTPDRQLLAKLKRVAILAQIDAKQSTLHKFRRTAITTWLRSKLDIKTVQRLAGHASLESTLRYLRALEPESLTDHMDSIF